MSLMFQRLARNFAKNGYFPTDEKTLTRILSLLKPGEGAMRLFDPCCGEGTALAECKHHLANAKAFGVELDQERAWHAKQILDCCINGDLMDCLIENQSFGLLFLNPPYGDLASDHAGETRLMHGRQRLEKLFYQRSVPLLQMGGIMVLIIPYYCIDKEFAAWIARRFSKITAFMAPEQQFKQAVIIGERAHDVNIAETRAKLLEFAKGKNVFSEKRYTIPAVKKPELKFTINKLDARQLAEIVKNNPCLWRQFTGLFHKNFADIKRPLMDLSNWHLALALAAGQVSGIVHSRDNRRYLIKGDTYKKHNEHKEEGKRVLLDKFVPVIRAIDFTVGTTYGNVLTIQ